MNKTILSLAMMAITGICLGSAVDKKQIDSCIKSELDKPEIRQALLKLCSNRRSILDINKVLNLQQSSTQITIKDNWINPVSGTTTIEFMVEGTEKTILVTVEYQDQTANYYHGIIEYKNPATELVRGRFYNSSRHAGTICTYTDLRKRVAGRNPLTTSPITPTYTFHSLTPLSKGLIAAAAVTATALVAGKKLAKKALVKVSA